MATRWGIAGTGLICRDFAAGLAHLGVQEHVLVSVASRYLKDAQNFAEEWGVSQAYEGYSKLAEDPNVDIVYIGLINPIHFEVTKLMLESGKHVLCEKPICMSSKEIKELAQMARKKKLFLMEAIWSRCFPIYQKLQELMTDGTLGKVEHVNVTFGKKLLHVPRVMQKELGGGGCHDIGVYILQLATLAFNRKKPVEIKAVGDKTKDGVDLSGAISLAYEDGGIASLCYTVKNNLPSNAIIGGTNGTVEIKEPFWCPEKLILTDKSEYISKLPTFNKPVNFVNSEGLIYEIMEVRRCLKYGLSESPLLPLDESIILAEITEEVRRQIGAF